MKPPVAAAPVPLPRSAGWPALLLVVLLAAWRVGVGWLTLRGEASTLPGWLPGFTPMAALAFSGGFLLRHRLGTLVPLGAVLASDFALTALYHQALGAGELVVRYGCVLALAWLGGTARAGRIGAVGLVSGSLVGAVGFYVATNTACWLGAPAYPQNFAGWVQALTVGTPGYPPTWVFLRNSLVSDGLVSMLLAAVCLPWTHPARAGQTPAPRAMTS